MKHGGGRSLRKMALIHCLIELDEAGAKGTAESVPYGVKNSRACLICGMIKTMDQFQEQGCDNCGRLVNFRDDKERILSYGIVCLTKKQSHSLFLFKDHELSCERVYCHDGSHEIVGGALSAPAALVCARRVCRVSQGDADRGRAGNLGREQLPVCVARFSGPQHD